MITIRALLNQIRWDPEFGRGEFTVGYFDRIEKRIIKIPIDKVCFDPDDSSSFQLLDSAGQAISIPLHRICEVYRNGELIWQRSLVKSDKKGRGRAGY